MRKMLALLLFAVFASQTNSYCEDEPITVPGLPELENVPYPDKTEGRPESQMDKRREEKESSEEEVQSIILLPRGEDARRRPVHKKTPTEKNIDVSNLPLPEEVEPDKKHANNEKQKTRQPIMPELEVTPPIQSDADKKNPADVPALPPVTNPSVKNAPSTTLKGTIATYNGTPITRTEHYRLLNDYYGRVVFTRMVNRLLIKDEIDRRAIAITPAMIDSTFNKHLQKLLQGKTAGINLDEFLKYHTGMTVAEYKFRVVWMELALKELVKVDLNVSEVDLINYYYANKTRYSEPEQVRASHILISPSTYAIKGTAHTSSAGKREWEMALKSALQIQNKISSGADFTALAKSYSQDKRTASKGGDLGFFAHNTMIKPFEDAAFSLRTGEISDIVKTSLGYHLIKVTGHKTARVVPYAEVKAKVKEDYIEYIQMAHSNRLLARLLKQAIEDGRLKIIEESLRPRAPLQ